MAPITNWRQHHVTFCYFCLLAIFIHMIIVDTSGQQCPAPLIATKRVLKDAQTGDAFKVITDSQTAFNNICRFLKDNKAKYSSEESNGIWTLTITKQTPEFVNAETEKPGNIVRP
jgi:TusA-related sulfurtransferase